MHASLLKRLLARLRHDLNNLREAVEAPNEDDGDCLNGRLVLVCGARNLEAGEMVFRIETHCNLMVCIVQEAPKLKVKRVTISSSLNDRKQMKTKSSCNLVRSNTTEGSK